MDDVDPCSRRRTHRPPAVLRGPARLVAGVVGPLKIAVGSALLEVNRLIRDADGRPVQWLNGLYRPDRYQYAMQLSRIAAIDTKIWVSKDVPAQFH
jgi:GntR family transcriptional regulator